MKTTGTPRRWLYDLVITLVTIGGFFAGAALIIASVAASPRPLGAGTVALLGLVGGLSPMVLLAAIVQVMLLLAERRADR